MHDVKKTGLMIALLCLAFSSIPVRAETPSILIKLTVGSKSASVNGKNTELDVPPTIIQGRTLVPIRFIAESLGAEVQYDAPTRTILIKAIDGKELLKLNNQHQQTIQSLETQIEALKKQLESGTGGIQVESDPPLVQCKNITDQTIITKLTPVEVNLIDQSPIAWIQTKIGDNVISNLSQKYGVINPLNFLSGNYVMKIEAWDAFGNHGETDIKITIRNDETSEPVSFKTEIKEFTRIGPGGPPGGGGGGGQQPPGDRPPQLPYALTLHLENQSSSFVEITNLVVYDTEGKIYQTRSEISTIDSIKAQTGLSRIVVLPTGSFSIQTAMNMLTEEMRKEDLFKGWKIVITLSNANMKGEMTKTILIS